MNTLSWGDNDRRFGPFLFARDRRYKHLALLLNSGDDEYPSCSLRFSCYGVTLIVSLPQIIKPYVGWVDLSDAEWATPGKDGRKGYTEVNERVYGFSYCDGFLQIKRGRSTMDSTTDRTKGYFLPWTQWRFVRHSFYGLKGEHVATLPDTVKSYLGDHGRWDRERAIADATPTVSFSFKDFDGEELTATTKVEEREWKFGIGYFKWLSLFRRAKVSRSLDIQFSGETGMRKGSWKGGIIGHSIDMLPSELHEAAFRRYCNERGMTFIGAV